VRGRAAPSWRRVDWRRLLAAAGAGEQPCGCCSRPQPGLHQRGLNGCLSAPLQHAPAPASSSAAPCPALRQAWWTCWFSTCPAASGPPRARWRSCTAAPRRTRWWST
jgi:hypothetical protein